MATHREHSRVTTVDNQEAAAAGWSRPNRYQVRIVVAAIIFAVVVRLSIALWLGLPDQPIAHENGSVARALATGHGFANAFGVDSGPTAHLSPLPPVLLAGLYRMFGLGKAGAAAQLLYGFLQVAVLCGLMIPLAEILRLSAPSAAIGAILLALPTHWQAELGEGDNALAAIAAVISIIFIGRLMRRDRWSAGDAVRFGLLAAASLMISPPFLLWFLVLGILGLLRQRSIQFLKFIAASAITAAVCLSPWMFRNEVVFGAPIWFRSNLGLELSLAHQDGTFTEWREAYAAGWFSLHHPTESAAERDQLKSLGEVAYNHQKLRLAEAWALSHPGLDLRFFLHRVLSFWFPIVQRPIHTAWLAITTLLGLIGLARWMSAPEIPAELKFAIGSLLLTFPLIYYLVLSEPRYSYPLVPVMLIFAGDLISHLWHRQVRTA